MFIVKCGRQKTFAFYFIHNHALNLYNTNTEIAQINEIIFDVCNSLAPFKYLQSGKCKPVVFEIHSKW